MDFKKIYNYSLGIFIGIILYHLWTILKTIDITPDPTIDINRIFLFIAYSFGWGLFIGGLFFLKSYLNGKSAALKELTIFNGILIGYSFFLFLIFSVLNSSPAPLSQWVTGSFRKVSLLSLAALIVLIVSRLRFIKRIHEKSYSS